MRRKKQAENLWTVEDERKHPSSILEWWSVIVFFTSKEDQKHWNLKATLSEGVIDPTHFGSLCNIALFDEEKNHHYIYTIRHLKSQLQSRQDVFDVRHGDSSMKGSYPSYNVHVQDPENDIEIDMMLHAESLPYWVAQEATNGWLPMGLGVFRYGFIPKIRISGTMKIQGKLLTIEGTGYFEHIWGSFSYRNPLSLRKDLKKIISIYARLIVWWLQNQKPRIPSSLMWSTENNPLGYDWAWAVLDNGWMIFYGNILCWLMEGPATGMLILSKDGRKYTEFSTINFRYTKTTFAHNYHFVYPTEFEITAFHEKETLNLRFTMTAECREYISRISSGKYWLGFVTCEAPGTVKGYYMNDKEKILLSGKCKIEPQRQASILSHNSLRIDILKPPRGVGISLDVDSHYLEKRITARLQFLPKPILRFSCKRIKDSKDKIKTKPK
jgi:hypothetical protein